jgi:hypothetical protein
MFESSEEEEDPNAEPILPKDDPNFKAMEADFEKRAVQRRKDKKIAEEFKEKGNELQQRISLKRIADEKNNKVWKVDLLKEELQLNRDAGLESMPESNENNKMPV